MLGETVAHPDKKKINKDVLMRIKPNTLPEAKNTKQKLSYFDCHVQQLTQEWVLEVKEKVAQELAGLLLYKQIKYQHKLK